MRQSNEALVRRNTALEEELNDQSAIAAEAARESKFLKVGGLGLWGRIMPC